MTKPTPDEPRRMQCLEVWGGNQPMDGGVVMSGLDAWVFSRPVGGEDQGGDVYYVSSCATGRVTRLLVADVSGHGAQVAATGAALRTMMRRYVNHIDQRRFVRALNRAFGAHAADGGFATAVAASFFGPTREMSMCLAGHPPPLFYSAKAKAWTVLWADEDAGGATVTDIPLGVIDATSYRQFVRPLRVGDLVLLYTDGLMEARGADGGMLGPEGVRAVAATLDVEDPATFVPRLRDAVAALHPGNLESDDLTMLLFRPNGLGPRVPFLRRAIAPLHVMGAVAKSLLKRDGAAPWPEMGTRAIGGAFVSGLNKKRRD